ESSAVAAARLREPVRDDLYRFVDTIEQGEGSTPAAIEVSYGITYTWDDLVGAIQEIAPTIMEGVNQRVTERYHAHTASLMEGEARASRTAWAQSMDASDATRFEILEAARVLAQPKGVAKELVARDVDRNINGDDNHVSGTDLKKKMTDKYCPRGDMKKLDSELWKLRVKKSDKNERYVGGSPDVIHGSIVASRPKTMQEAIEMTNELMDKRNNTLAER
nr:hypothetical protein [Tanacetum cinerariifolium]